MGYSLQTTIDSQCDFNLQKIVHSIALPDIKLVYNTELFTLDELKLATKSMHDGKAAGLDMN